MTWRPPAPPCACTWATPAAAWAELSPSGGRAVSQPHLPRPEGGCGTARSRVVVRRAGERCVSHIRPVRDVAVAPPAQPDPGRCVTQVLAPERAHAATQSYDRAVRDAGSETTKRVRTARAAGLLAAGDLGAEGVELLVPEHPELLDPGVDLLQAGRVDGVEPPGALGADGREAVVAQHLEVLAHRRLADPELVADPGRHVARAGLAGGEQLEDAAAYGVAEDVEGVHAQAGARRRCRRRSSGRRQRGRRSGRRRRRRRPRPSRRPSRP